VAKADELRKKLDDAKKALIAPCHCGKVFEDVGHLGNGPGITNTGRDLGISTRS
jgi:hypothetical protein